MEQAVADDQVDRLQRQTLKGAAAQVNLKTLLVRPFPGHLQHRWGTIHADDLCPRETSGQGQGDVPRPAAQVEDHSWSSASGWGGEQSINQRQGALISSTEIRCGVGHHLNDVAHQLGLRQSLHPR
jgi:hypothetical protein